jgi:hypothetical protein
MSTPTVINNEYDVVIAGGERPLLGLANGLPFADRVLF